MKRNSSPLFEVVISMWTLTLLTPIKGVKFFFGTNIEDHGFIVSSNQIARSNSACTLLCHIDPNCSLFQFSKELGTCSKILRDESTEPKPTDVGGIKAFVDQSKPCKCTYTIFQRIRFEMPIIRSKTGKLKRLMQFKVSLI